MGISPEDETSFEISGKANVKRVRRRSAVSELISIVPSKSKLSRDIDVKKLSLSETLES